MGCAQDTVTIKPGRNVWVLVRTDRDAADKAAVLQTAGGVLKRFLGRPSPLGTRDVFEVLQSPKDDPHDARFVIGAARPVLVDAFQASSPEGSLKEQPLLPPGVRTDYFADCPTPRSVAAQRPWFVTVEFDWRAQTTRTPWPHRAVNFLGMPYETAHGNDWLLVAAGHKGAPQEPDTSLGDEVLDEAAEQATAVVRAAKPWLLGLGVALGVGSVAYLVWRFGGDRPRREDTE